MLFTRRTLMQQAGLAAVTSSLPVLRAYAAHHIPFQHGVASGDPQTDRVILWTRITPDPNPNVTAAIPYTYEVALDPGMARVVASGSGLTGPAVDYTVKIDPTGLSAGTTYYYRFYSNNVASPIGRTRTLPVGNPGRLRFAFCSCSNYPAGFFHAYREIARRRDLEAVLHLGDYIYEYGPGGFGTGGVASRAPLPAEEIVTLSDYRERYAQYRTDPDLQEAHRQHPWITVWDDHESTNNAWKGGAQNHQPATEGDWLVRRAIASQVYFEWMPVREPTITDAFGQPIIYRSFRYGDLIDLIMLDTRIAGRDQQAALFDQATINDPNRSILGQEQEHWLFDQLRASQSAGTRWRILGQQVMLAQLGFPGVVFNPDQWDGYAASRKRLFDVVSQERINNLVVLTGDIHSSWAFDLTPDPFDGNRYNPFTGSGSIGVELVTTAISSPFLPPSGATDIAAIAVSLALPHLKYAEISRRGYTLIDVTRDRTVAEWYHLDGVVQPSYRVWLDRVFRVNANENRLRWAFFPTLPKFGAPPLAP